jgi:hypothetical protein
MPEAAWSYLPLLRRLGKIPTCPLESSMDQATLDSIDHTDESLI